MQLVHSTVVAAPRDAVWDFLMDVPSVARCVPGVHDLEPLADERYAGTLTVKVGPIQLDLRGKVAVTERDARAGRAKMVAEALDPRVGGGVNATMSLALAAADAGGTEVRITTDARLLGRLGELGQGLIKRKADQMVEAFAQNLQQELSRAERGTKP